MHDLNTINRLNAEAHEKSITSWRAEGKWVAAIYEGLTLLSATPHESAAAAHIAAHPFSEANTGRTINILPPLPAHFGKQRDQSEDRRQPWTLEELAALGRSETKTIGDYVAKVNSLEGIAAAD